MSNFEEQLKSAISHAYDIERELGGGGMSRVFVATDKSLGRKVVIKLLSPELTAEVNRGRFRREIQVAAQLQHPHIVTLLSAGEHGELVYYTMPFIRGESLKSALEKEGPMSVEEVVRVLYDVIDALAYAHENGVVHRDIKPANILRSGAHALVTDFGVAKALNAAMPTGAMTSTGMAIGTPAYMSPEQLAGDPSADHRIDIYAVGLLAYELLAGQSPFAATSPRGVLAAVLTREPTPLAEVRSDVPHLLSEMVMRCLMKEPESRPESAHALMAALDLFSTASGEIRTREHRVQATPVTPVNAQPSFTAPAPTFGTSPAQTADASAGFSQHSFSIGGNTAADESVTPDTTAPPKGRSKLLIGSLALLIPVAAGAIFLSQRPGATASATTAPLVDSLVADSLSKQAAITGVPESTGTAVQPPPGAMPARVGPMSTADSLAMADSAKKRAARVARADSLKKAAAAKTDSQRKRLDAGRGLRAARWAASAMLADPTARAAFNRGASRTGGLLGKQRRGDLQTQIDALQPFLAKNGLTYEQFKSIVNQSGINVYDEFGRLVPAALERFAATVD